ncbi:MAG: hypothetical protein ONB48_08130 [candidate division KSB1 bacterium]|nr:hypothetical protein [candidate division KSB1 bacterium]MDZ7274791.1 hypothetical protein [candidate division KSB1 bacterium]MDZ7285615.1 hypothetical protein [candidate division KSB1 bacterium]MDZ7298647.1 hypothetical protein [candidate division KSB1 bacterium]MDZ7307487.1 hypothetical protein [candidate division KSB1 bacterium]
MPVQEIKKGAELSPRKFLTHATPQGHEGKPGGLCDFCGAEACCLAIAAEKLCTALLESFLLCLKNE